ncbi:DUF805 domain-containing protein [Brevundimonas sp.]|uniref:DUF805 domain-containing protein n=1 Tax=Brevundimonas sp. TaxID=1871086 RepID=UPI0028A136AE|nr:DUF805 domain-containing protein [Brevundimonas sp.]
MEKIRALIIANFRWRGRLNRSGLYISIGLFYAFGLLALPLQVMLAVAISLDAAWLAVGLNGLLFIVGAAMAWNLLGAVVRRLHDRGKSGLWLLLFFGPHAAVVALISRIPLSEQKMFTLAMVLGMVVAAPFLVWGMVEIFCLRGREQTNCYGPDPLATKAGEPAASLP